MNSNIRSSLVAAGSVVVLLALAGALTPASAGSRRGVIGPDVQCSRVAMGAGGTGTDTAYYGTVDGIRGYSMASTSCNLGDMPADWADQVDPPRNPLIAQNFYRLSGNRFEQIGMSWVKHSFCALDETTCGNCQKDSDCDYLGVGCADTYWATLNGSQNYLGPRWEVNPMGVGPGNVHDDVYTNPTGPLGGRLQLNDSLINGVDRYFAEIQYVTHDESFEMRWNNASWREMKFVGPGGPVNMKGVELGQVSVHRGESAILAWQFVNPAVTIVNFEDDPGMGRMHLAYLVTSNGDGTWTYEYALHNLNSERAARSFSVPKDPAVVVDSTGFHDIDYHSGDGWQGLANFDGTDWPVAVGPSAVAWDTADFDADPNANALRWGTMYNFRFTADSPPQPGAVTVAMYKTGGRTTVDVPASVPGPVIPFCAEDLTDDGTWNQPDGVIDVFDLFVLLASWNTNGPGANIAAPTDIVDVFDLFAMLEAWGACE